MSLSRQVDNCCCEIMVWPLLQQCIFTEKNRENYLFRWWTTYILIPSLILDEEEKN